MLLPSKRGNIIPRTRYSQVNTVIDLSKKAESAKGNEKDQIQQQIENTDKEIDQLVYKLYGLTEEEIKIVENEDK